jgi:very-short-patch-repair endonuclease
VFGVGHPVLPGLGLEIAALLSAGDDSVLSHGSAAYVWGLRSNRPHEVHVTRVCGSARQPPGLRIHRVQELDVGDVRLKNGVPVTAPARTMIDIAGEDRGTGLEQALSEARVLGLVSDRELEAAMARAPNRTGVGRLRGMLAAENEPTVTRSHLERRLRALIGRAELPTPQFNVRRCSCLVDAVWESAMLVVEVDGFRFHGHRTAFERDHWRDTKLAAGGYRVARVSWSQLEREPLAVVAALAQALARTAP